MKKAVKVELEFSKINNNRLNIVTYVHYECLEKIKVPYKIFENEVLELDTCFTCK